jgi:hypothetical protein
VFAAQLYSTNVVKCGWLEAKSPFLPPKISIAATRPARIRAAANSNFQIPAFGGFSVVTGVVLFSIRM